jgi:hypothetical protein
MKNLTMEQKAKRYEWFEQAVLAKLDERIESTNYNLCDEEKLACDDIADRWIDDIESSNADIPTEIIYLMDKIFDEDMTYYHSIGRCHHEETRQKYSKFEKAIGEK